MTTRDLSAEDLEGFLQAHKQHAEDTRFAQLEEVGTLNTPMEDIVILLGIFCCCLVIPLGYLLWRLFA